MTTLAMSGGPDSQILNFVVRMVVPMRREFGRQLDVQQFMRDGTYARTVLEEAMTSRDPRLLEYANYVSQRLLSARIAAPSVPLDPAPSPMSGAHASPVTPAAPAAASPSTQAEHRERAAGDGAAPDAAGAASDDALRAKMLRKYTTGLR